MFARAVFHIAHRFITKNIMREMNMNLNEGTLNIDADIDEHFEEAKRNLEKINLSLQTKDAVIQELITSQKATANVLQEVIRLLTEAIENIGEANGNQQSHLNR